MGVVIHHSDDWLTIHQGDAATVLATLPADSVDCIVTSPPYWGLRDYGTATWIGGDEGCDHKAGSNYGSFSDTKPGQIRGGPFKASCGRCGASREDSQLGLEATPEEYVANLVGVFRELRRVLKPSGTCWLNLGDTYHGGGGGNYGSGISTASDHGQHLTNVRNRIELPGLKPKDLVGIPWRVAFALQADGWWLRSDIIWAKPNPMPESVTDRPTKAHEMVFLLTKSARYYFDAEAVREGIAQPGVIQGSNGHGQPLVLGQRLGLEDAGASNASIGVRLAATILDLAQRQHDLGLLPLDAEVGQQGTDGFTGASVVGIPVMRRAATQAARFADGDVPAKEFLGEMDRLCVALPDGDDLKEAWRRLRAPSLSAPAVDADGDGSVGVNDPGEVGEVEWFHDQEYTAAATTSSPRKSVPRGGFNGKTNAMPGREAFRAVTTSRNLRSVWTIATRPYPGAHFAVFPPELPERCIKAGSSERGVCPECGAPWERVTITGVERPLTGWQPTCRFDHGTDVDAAVVLDPFAGSGTVGLVANRLSRRAILIDLNPAYLEQQMKRNAQTVVGL